MINGESAIQTCKTLKLTLVNEINKVGGWAIPKSLGSPREHTEIIINPQLSAMRVASSRREKPIMVRSQSGSRLHRVRA